MKIRGSIGRWEFHPESDVERAIIGHAWRDAGKELSEEDDSGRRAIFYWGDGELDGKGVGAFILATWDERDYDKSELQIPVSNSVD